MIRILWIAAFALLAFVIWALLSPSPSDTERFNREMDEMPYDPYEFDS